MGETPSGGTGTNGGSPSAPAASGPSSFADASWTDASPASTPSRQTQGAATTDSSPSAEATPTPDDRSPFIPRARFDQINERLKAAEAWKQQRAWADSLSEAEFRDFVSKAQRISSDPVAHLTELIAELQNHPQHGQTLKSLAAKALAAGRGQQPAAMPEPDVQITDAAGNVAGMTYSAQQLAKRDEWLTQQLLAKVDERYAPTRETAEEIKRQAQVAKDKAEGDQFAKSFTAELKELYPTFDQHKTAIGQEVLRLLKPHEGTPKANDQAFLEAITLKAAQKIIGSSTRSQAESAVLDSLKQKAAASSSVNPNTAVASTPKRIDSFTQLPADAWR